MKGKHAKNTANKQKLAKRMLALCFAVVFLCSCVLPVFATGSSLLTDALREAVEETAASTDTSTEAGGGTMMDDFQTMVSSSEYKTTYRFWLSEKDSNDLPDAAKTSASDLEGYDDFYAVAAIANNTTLTAPEGFQNPTDPTDEGRTFEGWYYIDTYGLTQTFTFDDSPVLLDKSATIDVFAKWGEAPADDPADDADKAEGDTKADDTVKDDTKADDTVKDDTATDDETVSDDETTTATPSKAPAKASLVDEMAEYAATVSGTYTIKVGEQKSITGTAGYRDYLYSSWTSSNTNIVSIYQAATNNVIIEGEKAGNAKITHKYWSQRYRDWAYEYYTVTVEAVSNEEPATVFVMLKPTSDKNSNATSEWGYGIPGAKINVTGATWEDSNKNIKQNVSDYVLTWPGETESVTLKEGNKEVQAWDMPLTTEGYSYVTNGVQTTENIRDQIWSTWADEIKKDTGISDLTVNDIERIYIVPYKISRDNGTSGHITDMHIDCEIRVICKKVFVAKFHVLEAGRTDYTNYSGYTQISAKNYGIRYGVPDLIQENNGQAYRNNYPLTVEKNGILYRFNGWYDEAGQKVDSWGYQPKEAELKDGVVNFYAHYVREDTAFTIEKQVTGNMADFDEEFDFTITVQDSEKKDLTFKLDGAECTGKQNFKLKNGESVSLTDVPVGATITIQEKDATGYLTSAKLGNSYVGEQNQQDGGRFSFIVAEATTATQTMDDDEVGLMLLSLDDDVDTESATAGQKILVINSKDLEVPTGVILDTLPYVLMLIAVGGGVVAFFLRKRHHDDEE